MPWARLVWPRKGKKSLNFLYLAYLKPPSKWLVNLGRFGPLVAKSGLRYWKGHATGERWHPSKQGGQGYGESNTCAIKPERKKKKKEEEKLIE